MNHIKITLCAALGIAFAGCATVPAGPTSQVMPAAGKPFDLFQAENFICKDFARQQVGVDPNDVSKEQVVSGAAVGGVLGAAAGALMGHGHAGAVMSGAGVGILAGSAIGAGAANQSGMTLQRRYDLAYEQCMYAKGNQVPGYAPVNYTPPPPPPSSH